MRTYPFPLDLVRERSPERPVALVRPRSVSVAARWFQDNLKADVFYAVKANPSRWVIETLVEAGVNAFDVASLADHTNFLSNKITFLLDAILGMINLEQNRIIKVISVSSVVFLPPTLFASVWGMNFAHMPELQEPWAYPVALAIIIVSAIIPAAYFKIRGWL